MSNITLLWTKQFGTSTPDFINDIATDALGNIFVCGVTNAEIAPGEAVGDADAFLAKYDAAGNRQWIHQLGTSHTDAANAIAVDEAGNVVIGGFATGKLGNEEARGGRDIFVAKYDTAGHRIWMRQWGTANIDVALCLSIDQENSIYVGGFSDRKVVNHRAVGDYALLTKLDENGVQAWSKSLDSGKLEEAAGVATDRAGNVYVCGLTYGQLSTEASHGKIDAFLARYDTDGNQIWLVQLGTAQVDAARNVVTDHLGNVFICGRTQGALEAGQAGGDNDAYVAKYTSEGNQEWLRQIGTDKWDAALGIAVNQAGDIFVSGKTRGALVGDEDPAADAFLIKYDTNGDQQWIEQIGTTAYEGSRAVAVDAFGNIIFSGNSTGEMTAESFSNNSKHFNPFISKYQDAAAGLLVVPLHLKGLYVDQPTRTVGPSADFSYLPWNDGQQDINPDFAPLGEHVTTTPLDSDTGELQAGIHLHWTLPHGLSSAVTKQDGTQMMPYVPVQWDIVPIAQTGTFPLTARTLWSDALWPEDTPINQNKTVVPVPYRPGHASYRYMGQISDLGEALPNAATVEHFSDSDYQNRPLDCLGYDSLYFAPFYPNSREVFGYHEALEGEEDVGVVTYFVNAMLYQAGADHLPINQLLQDTGLSLNALLEQMEWPLNATSSLPTEIRLAGAVRIDTRTSALKALQSTPGSINFSLGNTGTEALSALLAKELAAVHGSRDKIEEQLEAILMHDKISGRSADLGLQFLEQRHRQGFRKLSAGTQWSINFKQRTAIVTAALKSGEDVSMEVLHSIGELDEALIGLNQAQRTYDKQREKRDSLRITLFGDWYKYMLTKYPGPESLEVFDTAPYPQIEEVGAWTQQRAQKLLEQTQELEEQALALVTKRDQLEELINILKAKITSVAPVIFPTLPLETVEINRLEHPAQPYYTATDPVVLIEGLDITQPDLQQGALGLQNYIYHLDLSTGNRAGQLQRLFEALYGEENELPIATGWNPFILEWEAEFLPTLDSYGKNAPQNNFALQENRPEAQFKEAEGYRNTNAGTLRGRTFLSPGAKVRQMAALGDFLKRKLAVDGLPLEAPLPILVETYLTSRTGQSDENDAVLTAARAYLELADKTILSQALGGFNEGLLQLETYEQPPLGDPLGTAAEQSFSEAIGRLVGRAAKYAPNPSNPFSPVRAGSFRLIGLRIIDTWGRYRDLLKEQDFVPAVSQTMRAQLGKSTKPTWASLPLRLSQAMRLHLHWLAAPQHQLSPVTRNVSDEFLPGVSPVLGWLNTNHLGQNLQFFHPDGSAIGYFNREAEALLPPPGSNQIRIRSNTSPAVNQLIDLVAQNGAEWLENFVQATQSALAQIAPHDRMLHPNTAIFTGRPIGIGRLRLRFDLRGIPAQDHSWEVLKEQIKNLQKGQNEPDLHWEKMMFPVRLGTYRKLNDGLVGFWQEDQHGRFNGPLHTMAAETKGAGILSHSTDSTLWLPLDGTPVNLTVLFDPRGAIHATTGALPVQSVQLQLDHYTDALNRIATWFLNAPLVQPAGADDKLYATPPPEPGFEWSWLEKQSDQSWQETTTFNATSERATLQQKAILREGWLKLQRD